MPVSPVFIGVFVFLFVFCVIIGLISYLPTGAQSHEIVKLRRLVCGSFVLFLVTEQCGTGGSNNSDFYVADALKNQDSALPVTLKLIQKS
jgi:hypothetical protein